MKRPAQTPKEPLFNLEEKAPVWLGSILLLAHIGFLLSPPSFQNFLREAGMLGAIRGDVFIEGRPLGNLATLLTHTLLHSGWSHILLNCAFIIAFGVISIRAVKNRYLPIAGRIERGSAVFLLIFLVGAITGGLLQWAVWAFAGVSGAALGASSGGAALFAATAWALGGKPRLLAFGAVVLAYDLIVIYSSGFVSGLHNPAWAAHLGGYLGGAMLSPIFLKPSSVGIGNFR